MKKVLILPFIVFCSVVIGQEPFKLVPLKITTQAPAPIERSISYYEAYTVKTYDIFEDDTTISMKNSIPIKINNVFYGSIEASLTKNKERVLLYFFVKKKLTCINEGIVYFIMGDKSRLKSYNSLEYNCKGNFSFVVFINSRFYNEDNLELLHLGDKNVLSLRLDCNEGSIELDLTKSQSEQLKNSLKGLILQTIGS